MRISKQTKDAIRTLVFLTRSDQVLHAIPDIASAVTMTDATAFKLIPSLVRAGFLETERGRGGGVKLAVDPGDISVGNVVRALENIQGAGGADDQSVILDEMVGDAFSAFLDILDGNTIADLASGQRSDLDVQRSGTVGGASQS